jgi:predicted proteasome-type protease
VGLILLALPLNNIGIDLIGTHKIMSEMEGGVRKVITHQATPLQPAQATVTTAGVSQLLDERQESRGNKGRILPDVHKKY